MRNGREAADNGAPLSLQDALFEIGRPQRTREITSDDLPAEFSFPSEALAYGLAQMERGVHIFEELGQPTETQFTFRLDAKTGDFALADLASRPEETRKEVLVGDGYIRERYSPEPMTRESQRQRAFREIRILLRHLFTGKFKVSEANLTAMHAHTHPPLEVVEVPDSLDAKKAAIIRTALLPLNVNLPSTADMLAPAAASRRRPSMVFAPGGLTIVMVPTDKTPVIDTSNYDEQLEAIDSIEHEKGQLKADYTTALATGEMSPLLAGIFREMYRHDTRTLRMTSQELLLHYMQHVMYDGQSIALHNPITFFQMKRLGEVLPALGMVGYYNFATTDGTIFKRFTA